MRILDPHFAGPLLAAMLATQALCWLLARGLGLRLRRSAVLGGWIAPLVVLAPWLAGPALLAPCKLLVGFQGTWLLARSTGRSRASSLLAAAGFALGGGLFSWALFPVTTTAVWVPWLAAGTVRLCRHPGRRAVATTAAITALILLS